MQKKEITTTYRKELKEQILNTALKEFREKGIKSVKMDDIAGRLFISKRTLYEIYSDKEQLLFECVKRNYEEKGSKMKKLSEHSSNVMDIIIEFFRMQVENISRTNPLFFAELDKYPDIMKYLNIRHDEQDKNTIEFFREGIRQGYFLDKVNFEIVVKLGRASMTYVMETKMYDKYPLQDIFRDFVTVYIRGFCTDKGIAVIDKFLDEN